MFSDAALAAPLLEYRTLDLEGAERVTYLLQQSFRYEYPGPVEQLRQRLVVLPPARHGNQHLRSHRLEVAGAATRRRVRRDRQGNTVVRLRADRVEDAVEFRIRAVLERVTKLGPVRLPAAALADPRMLRATRLTAPDDALRELAGRLGGPWDDQLELANAVCQAVHSAMTYRYGVTSVSSTAAEALAGGEGVCQDSAHIMLALCHLLALPARYVSGHLLGQGGTHAWVEVLVPRGDHTAAMPFDPCNGVPGSARYLTVATGRDYADVAPTSGSYRGAAGGALTTTRQVGVLAVA